MIEPLDYTLKHPVQGVRTLKISPPTLRTFVNYGTPYKVERTQLDNTHTQFKLTANFIAFRNFLVDMTRKDRDFVEAIDAEDLSELLLIVREMSLHSPEAAAKVFDDLVFNSATRLPLNEVENMDLDQAVTIRDRAIQYVKRTQG